MRRFPEQPGAARRRPMRRRLLRWAMIGGGAVAAILVVGLMIITHNGKRSVTDWIGLQIEGIANSYLNPHLSFTDLEYHYPLGVSLRNLRLTADDPRQPGRTIDLIACRSAQVSLAEIPTPGKPIVIEKIVLDQPLISAVAVAPGSAKFIGFSNLVRGAATQPAQQQSSSSTGRLSDAFRMRLVQIDDGRVVYDPRIAGTVPMELDQINTALHIQPAEAGWYTLDADISRRPVFDLHVAGQLSLDTFDTRGLAVNLLADLGEDKLDYLPPQLQAMLRRYDIRGKLALALGGSTPLMDPAAGQLTLNVNLDGANIASGGLRIPIDHLSLRSQLHGGVLTLASLHIAALHGTADFAGTLPLGPSGDSRLTANVNSLQLEKMQQTPGPATRPSEKMNVSLAMDVPVAMLHDEHSAQPATLRVKDLQLSGPHSLSIGNLLISVNGSAPAAGVAGADVTMNLRLDDGTITAGDYRVSVQHVKLPVHLHDGQVELLDAATLGGPTIEALGGFADISGSVRLNPGLDTTGSIEVQGMRLQDLMADQISQPKKDLAGDVQADVEFFNAPLRRIAANLDAMPATLPSSWGSADISLSKARLAGLQVVQGVQNIAKSVFSDLFEHSGDDHPADPDESARVVCGFNDQQINISQMHYDGDLVAADGKGFITLAQHVNLDLTGGPISKLGGLGSVGNWIKNASDSLLYYHVAGTLENLTFVVRAGDGKPIVNGVKSVADTSVHAVSKGLDKAGSFLGGLFGGHKDNGN